ncbi:MAG: flagellar FlbD family protein [Anaerovorax sp.]|nr:flagellar FlbD family protein [Anaerovorax sp.]
MIKLTKLNNEEFIVNSNQIQMIELIPEAKIVLMNREFFVVRESAEEIIEKIIQYNAKIIDAANITVVKNQE